MLKTTIKNIKHFFKKSPRLAKREDFSKMQEVFKDRYGKRYYKYVNDYDIPQARYDALQSMLQELEMVLSRNELRVFIKAMKKAISETPANIAQIGFLLTEMEDRQTYLVHGEIMFRITCCLYIREDQNPYEWDEEFEAKKAIILKEEAKGDLFDFFYTAGLGKYLPFLKDMRGTLEQQLEMTKKKQQAIEKMMNESLGLDPELLKTIGKSEFSI